MTSQTTNKFSPEVRARAVRIMIHEKDHLSRQVTVGAIVEKIGGTPQAPHERIKKVEVDADKQAWFSMKTAEKLQVLERENRELLQVNGMPRKASAYLVQAELDRPFKR